MYKIISLAVLALLISGCGSSGGSEQKVSTSYNTGYLIDSAITGIEYTCDDISGITDKDGMFSFNDTCEVSFKIGNIIIGSIKAENINNDKNVLPTDLFELDRDNVSNEKLITLIQFLQTLDEDNNPDNNIQISKEVQESFKNHYLDFKQDSNLEDEIANILVDIKKDLVTKDNALKHYKKTLEKKFKIQLITNPTVKEEVVEVVQTPEEVQVEEEVVEVVEVIQTPEEVQVEEEVVEVVEVIQTPEEVQVEEEVVEVVEVIQTPEEVQVEEEVVEVVEVIQTPEEVQVEEEVVEVVEVVQTPEVVQVEEEVVEVVEVVQTPEVVQVEEEVVELFKLLK